MALPFFFVIVYEYFDIVETWKSGLRVRMQDFLLLNCLVFLSCQSQKFSAMKYLFLMMRDNPICSG
jgi:hypothetical protein